MATVKEELWNRGLEMLHRFCRRNKLRIPPVLASLPAHRFYIGACGCYRYGRIHVDAALCAFPSNARAGPAWSWPGWMVDRTPYGVFAHELGHHVDLGCLHIGKEIRRASQEEKLTNYCPNTDEWFAEMCRLFITNPDLMRGVRPLTYAALIRTGLKPTERRGWFDVLEGAPERVMKLAESRMP